MSSALYLQVEGYLYQLERTGTIRRGWRLVKLPPAKGAGASYVVTDGRCTCNAAKFGRGKACKHALALVEAGLVDHDALTSPESRLRGE